MPQEMHDANTITVYKNKGDCSDCNSYRGIYLLSVTGKAFARVVLNRLQTRADRVPCGTVWVHSWNLRSKVDMIFSLRQLQEKCREQRKTLYIALIDLAKAFDLVNTKGLFTPCKGLHAPHSLKVDHIFP